VNSPQPDDEPRVNIRRPLIGICVILALAETLLGGIGPLLPEYARRLSLSGFRAASLLGATSLAMLIVSFPSGVLVERVGVRRMTVLATSALCLAAVANGVATDYSTLLLSRLAVGAAGGVVWTSGLAWLRGTGSAGTDSRLGSAVVVGGIGLVFGPGFFGLLAGSFGLRAPFFIIAAAILGAAPLLRQREAVTRNLTPVPPSRPPRGELGSWLGRPNLQEAVLALSSGAVASGLVGVIVPFELHRSGESAGTIGLILLITGLGYLAAGGTVAVLGSRAVSTGAALAASAIAVAAMLPTAISTSVAAVVGSAALLAVMRGFASTLCYPLACRAADERLPAATIFGYLNSVWAGISVVVPLAAGWIFDAVGPRSTFVVAQVAVGLGVIHIILKRRRSTAPRRRHRSTH
jgi:predicted MFS family arabinose efflux permease